MKKTSINYGIISTASIVPRFVNALKESGNGNAVAISSRSLNKAKDFAEKLGINNYYDDYRILLDDPHIDCIYVPLINSLHYPYAKEALSAGKSVIVEKPFTMHANEAEELFNIAREKGLFITEAVKTPFLPVYNEVKKIIDSEEFGKIHTMVFRQSYVGGQYSGDWYKDKNAGGGSLYGNEAYFFTMAEYLGGKVIDVAGTCTYGEYEVENQYALSATLENSILAMSTVSSEVLLNNGLFINLDDARIEIPDYWKARSAFIYQNNELISTIEYPCRYEMQYEIRHYNDCILNGLSYSPVIKPEDTIRHIQLCEQIYEQWERKKGNINYRVGKNTDRLNYRVGPRLN